MTNFASEGWAARVRELRCEPGKRWDKNQLDELQDALNRSGQMNVSDAIGSLQFDKIDLKHQLSSLRSEVDTLKGAIIWAGDNLHSGVDWHGSLDPDYPQGFYVCAHCEAKWKPNGDAKQLHNEGCHLVEFRKAILAARKPNEKDGQ